MADLLEDREIFDSSGDNGGDDNDNDNPSSLKQILVFSKRQSGWFLIGHDNDDREGNDSDFTELSWLRTTRTARYFVMLFPPYLVDRIQVANQLGSPSTALSTKVARIYYRRPYNIVCSGHTWQEENPLAQYS